MNKNNIPIIKFFAKFLLLLAIFSLTYSSIVSQYDGPMAWLRTTTARIVGTAIQTLSGDVVTDENEILFKGQLTKIIDECTGITELLIVLAAIVSYPTTMANKLYGIGAGILLIYLMNLVRILILIWIRTVSEAMFELLHVYLWQATTVLFVIMFFILWIKKVVIKVSTNENLYS